MKKIRSVMTHSPASVLTKGAEVVGIFTATDACRCFAEHLRRHSSPLSA